MSAPEGEGSAQVEAAGVRDTGPFSEGEKVLAYHGPKIYEAKIQRAELQKKDWKYFVHYLGWSKSWDEWLKVDRLLKINDDNRSRQEASHEKGKGKAKAGRDGKQEKDDAKAPAGGRGKKRKHEGKGDGTGEDKEEEPEHVVKVQIPAQLKKQLVDDWNLINVDGKLISLPTEVTVNEILRRYLEFKSSKDGAAGNGNDMSGQVVDGLRTYFDRSLPALLLYKSEREQHNKLFPEDATLTPSAVYGGEHLLRLFVKLPELLVHTNMEEEALGHLQQRITEFLKYLQKNHAALFSATYEPATGVAPPVKGSQKQ